MHYMSRNGAAKHENPLSCRVPISYLEHPSAPIIRSMADACRAHDAPARSRKAVAAGSVCGVRRLAVGGGHGALGHRLHGPCSGIAVCLSSWIHPQAAPSSVHDLTWCTIGGKMSTERIAMTDWRCRCMVAVMFYDSGRLIHGWAPAPRARLGFRARCGHQLTAVRQFAAVATTGHAVLED